MASGQSSYIGCADWDAPLPASPACETDPASPSSLCGQRSAASDPAGPDPDCRASPPQRTPALAAGDRRSGSDSPPSARSTTASHKLPVLGAQRQGQTVQPFAEKSLDVFCSQAVAGLLQPAGVGTGAKAIIQC